MADISQYLAALIAQKNQLAENLAAMGVDAQQSEKLNTLVPKVLNIKQGSDFAVEGYYKDGYFYEDENFTREIEPDYTKIYTDLSTGTCYRCTGAVYKSIIPKLSDHLETYKLLLTAESKKVSTILNDELYSLAIRYNDASYKIDINTGVTTTFTGASNVFKWSSGMNGYYRYKIIGDKIVALSPYTAVGYESDNTRTTYKIISENFLVLNENLIWDTVPLDTMVGIDIFRYEGTGGIGSVNGYYKTYEKCDAGTIVGTDEYILVIEDGWHKVSVGWACGYHNLKAYDKQYVRTDVITDQYHYFGRVLPNLVSHVFNGKYAVCVGGVDNLDRTNVKTTACAIDNNLQVHALADNTDHMVYSLNGVIPTTKHIIFVGQSSFRNTLYGSGDPAIIVYDDNLVKIEKSIDFSTYGNTVGGQCNPVAINNGDALLFNKGIDGMFYIDKNLNIIESDSTIPLPPKDINVNTTDSPSVGYYPVIYGRIMDKIIRTGANNADNRSLYVYELKECGTP